MVLPQRFLYWCALRISDFQWLVDKHAREAVKANLRNVLPDASEARIQYETRWVFRNFGKYLTEFFRFSRFDDKFFSRHTALDGRKYLDEALAQNKGAIILSAHLSNWELGAAIMHKMFPVKVNVIIQRHLYEKADKLFIQERASVGINAIHLEHAPIESLRALKRGEIICILGDRDPTEQGIEVEFFGKICRFPQGPARIALKSGSPIVPAFVLRRTNDSFTLCFRPAIPVPETGTKDEKVRQITQTYAHVIEDAIRWHPEEWSVFYRVWEETWKP